MPGCTLAHSQAHAQRAEWPMNWDRIAGGWKQVKNAAAQRWGRRRQKKADEKRLAEWLAREHKADPIHK